MIDTAIVLDLERNKRVGFDEAILCAGKSAAQIEAILQSFEDKSLSCLLTRLSIEANSQIPQIHAAKIDYDPVSKTAFFNWTAPAMGKPRIAVVTAGSSDLPVAKEAIRTLTYLGMATEAFIDVGVAGLWRLLNRIDELRTYPVIIAVAGMDGALPSVLGGLVPGVVIAVPTSTGYGASRGGQTALNAALASCAPGLSVVNIDNGYGAACAAYRAASLGCSSQN